MQENKRYKWEPETEFKFNGQEFSIMYNNIQNYLNGITTPSSILRIVDAFKILQTKLDDAIANGDAKEEEIKQVSAATAIEKE